MTRKIALFAGALVLMFSAGAAQAHGSLFGVFFKYHAHDACGNHYQDYHADARKACKKKHYGKHHVKHYRPYKYKYYVKKHHYGYHHKPKHYHHGAHYEPKSFIW